MKFFAALRALVALPDARISTATLGPNDVIVIELDAMLTPAGAERLRATVEQVWPGRRTVILADGIRLKVVAAPLVFPPNRKRREGDL